MSELNAGILSEGLAAQTKVREEKIPVEVRLPDGTVAHPSGFEPPTAETEFHPIAAKVPTEEHPLLSTVKQPWDQRDFVVEAGAGEGGVHLASGGHDVRLSVDGNARATCAYSTPHRAGTCPSQRPRRRATATLATTTSTTTVWAQFTGGWHTDGTRLYYTCTST